MGKKVTVLGSGNGGLTAAFHLASLGIEVTLWSHPEFSRTLEGVKTRGGIEAVERFEKDGFEIDGKLTGFVKLAGITTDIEEALQFSDILLLILPSFAHEGVLQCAMPHLRSGQIIVIIPGNFTSLVFAKMLRDAGSNKDVTFVETNTLPYGCRIAGPGQVFINMMRTMLKLAAFPGNRISDALERIKDILPLDLIPRKNVLEASFANPNLITHSVTAALNIGWIESGDCKFHFYKEGMSESISRVIQKIDDERLEIGKSYGLSLIPYLEVISAMQGKSYSSIHEYVMKNPLNATIGYSNPKGPRDRYITEDTPYLLVPVHEFGKLAEIHHPAIESIINLSNIFNLCDYYKEGRTLEKMGLQGMSIKEILEYVENG